MEKASRHGLHEDPNRRRRVRNPANDVRTSTRIVAPARQGLEGTETNHRGDCRLLGTALRYREQPDGLPGVVRFPVGVVDRTGQCPAVIHVDGPLVIGGPCSLVIGVRTVVEPPFVGAAVVSIDPCVRQIAS